jgi:DNA polymerase-1
MLFHNHRFDVQVAETWMGMPRPKVIEDTMILLYLLHPHERSISLKESAQRILDIAPEERDLVKEWVLANIRCKPSEWGAFICLAPGTLVGPYANGDVTRTLQLWNHLRPKLDEGMERAYERELALAPILDDKESFGIRVDRDQLYADERKYTNVRDQCDLRIRKAVGRAVNVDSNGDLAEALEAAGLADPTLWLRTPTGARSVAKDSLRRAVTAPDMLALLQYRNAINTCLTTFMQPWLELSQIDGRLHTSWHHVRGDTAGGTRTGRLSSSHPNFQNVPNEFDFVIPAGAPPIPLMRRYLLPEPGHVWVKRDFSSQEVRILAHFEDGPLAAAYQADPLLDPHKWTQDTIKKLTGQELSRKIVKITGFSILYGSGITGLSGTLNVSDTEARNIRDSYLGAIPGIRNLQNDLRDRSRAGIPIRTWGGRLYYAEEPRYINGKYKEFGYKLLNYLIQGSAADQTKQVMIDWHRAHETDWHMLNQVHDEINLSVPADQVDDAMHYLETTMNQDMFDVPMRSEGFTGPNWCDLEDYK